MNRTFHSWVTDKDKGKAGPGTCHQFCSEFYDPTCRLFPRKYLPRGRMMREVNQGFISSLTLELENWKRWAWFSQKKKKKKRAEKKEFHSYKLIFQLVQGEGCMRVSHTIQSPGYSLHGRNSRHKKTRIWGNFPPAFHSMQLKWD